MMIGWSSKFWSTFPQDSHYGFFNCLGILVWNGYSERHAMEIKRWSATGIADYAASAIGWIADVVLDSRESIRDLHCAGVGLIHFPMSK